MSIGKMNRNLHITNGDSALVIMQDAGIEGLILPWRDVLHDGPVPAGLELQELSRLRADYISRVGWGSFDDVLFIFRERDALVLDIDHFANVSLWFEHDLYDQLQILQILDALASKQSGNTHITLACSDNYLGEMNAAAMLQFQSEQRSVTPDQYILAQAVWSAFREDNPVAWAALRDKDISALPFLRDTVERTLQEFPDSQNGVSRTERQILSIVASGEARPWRVFEQNQQQEKRIFMGDSSFWLVINRLLDGPQLLLSLNHGKPGSPPDPTQSLTLTALGERILAGELNWLDLHTPDYFIGGTRCCSKSLWCFDQSLSEVVCK